MVLLRGDEKRRKFVDMGETSLICAVAVQRASVGYASCAMSGEAKERRVPKVGDRVFVRGHPGAFVVFEMDIKFQTAKLVRIGSSYPVLDVEWRFLGYVDAPKGR